MTFHHKHFTFLILTFLLIVSCNSTKNDSNGTTEEDVKVYIEFLQNTMHTQKEWVKVHAAEYLIWSGNKDGVSAEFLKEEKQFGTSSPYRIGIWRVLAQESENAEEKEKWITKIENAFLDTLGKDRVHAAETLAKLKKSTLQNHPEITQHALESKNIPLAMYTLWSTAYTSEDSLKKAPEKFIKLIQKAVEDPKLKSTPGFALRQMRSLNKEQLQKLSQLALDEPIDSPAKVYLLSAAYVSSEENDSLLINEVYHALLQYSTSDDKGKRSEMAAALAERGGLQDLTTLTSLFNNEVPLENEIDNMDVSSAAAYAILKIKKKASN